MQLSYVCCSIAARDQFSPD